MNYVIKPCVNEDSEYIAGKYDEETSLIMPPDPNGTDETFVFKIDDDEGSIIGGCILHVDNWMVANISCLWVDAYYRGHGLGSALISAAEEVASQKHCSVAVLGTYDFQAMPFYEKLGYTMCGAVTDLPLGHENYSMAKQLEDPLSYVTSRAADGENTYMIRLGSEEDAEALGDRLCKYDNSIVPFEHESEALERKVVDGEGNLVAGAVASIDCWNCMQIEFIWVDYTLRNRGLGSKLLRSIECEAREHGSYIAIASVNEWQALFLMKHGYKICSAIEDCPKGHCWLLLKKRL